MYRSVLASLLFTATLVAGTAAADETCMSPYMAKIVGQEDFVYVWALGMDGVGDGQDKLVTVDVNPKSPKYGKVVSQVSVGGRNEAHHAGYTDDRRFLWATTLDTSKIFIFDVYTDPARPKLVRTIDDFVARSGGVAGPHTNYALPGRMLLTGLSNKSGTGPTGMVEYTNDGEYVTTHWMPTDKSLEGALKTGQFADGYGYDVRALPRLNLLVTSSFAGKDNYMRNLGSLMADPEAMKHFGNTVVTWDLHTRQPKKIFDVPGAPLEIRCAWGPNHNYCFTSTALTAKIWLIYLDDNGEWQAKAVADIGDASKIPLPVDISISSNDDLLWVDSWNDGMTRLYDITNPHAPKQIYEQKIGEQVNMVSESWDGQRVYFTSSLLTHWDKTAPAGPDLQYLKAFTWDGKKLTPAFALDFVALQLGAPHHMHFGAYALYGQKAPAQTTARPASENHASPTQVSQN
ncbi:MAG TPA: selenium-binding protein SBP56-related protein [Pseudomonadales bacterium]|nr:selenium-binding protein SBP56-related protein [Pseudomonadales bacterium]